MASATPGSAFPIRHVGHGKHGEDVFYLCFAECAPEHYDVDDWQTNMRDLAEQTIRQHGCQARGTIWVVYLKGWRRDYSPKDLLDYAPPGVRATYIVNHPAAMEFRRIADAIRDYADIDTELKVTWCFQGNADSKLKHILDDETRQAIVKEIRQK